MTATSIPMAPDASPGGVRRVNNRPIYILISVVAVTLLVLGLSMVDRSARQAVESSQDTAASTHLFIQEIIGDYPDGIIQPAAPPAPPAMLDPAPPARESAPVARSVAPLVGPAGLDKPRQMPQQDDEAQRIRTLKLQRLEAAIAAKTSVPVTPPRRAQRAVASGTPRTRQEMLTRIEQVRQEIAATRDLDPTAAYQARLAQIKGDTGGGFGLGGAPAAAAAGDYAQFDHQAGGDRWRLDTQVQEPRSPFVLLAGFVVPAMLISAINSDLPGQIVAQVAQNVFDTATGRHRLIPQGARLVGLIC